MVSFPVPMIIGKHRTIVCLLICKIMIVISIADKQRMLVSDIFMENHFVNSALGSNGQVVIFAYFV